MERPVRIKREIQYRGSIVNVYKDSMQMPDGKVELWDFVEHVKGAAAVVAVLENGNILMVRQYRNALERETIELPAGARDSVDEDMALCAARELEEETGYRCTSLTRLLSLRTTVAFCSERIDVFLALGLKKGIQKLDEHEYIEIEEYSLPELCEKIYAGEIQDSKTVAGVMAYAQWVSAR